MDATEEVWVTLRAHEPLPGLVLRWAERNGLRWAYVTYEMDERVRTEWLPRMAIRERRAGVGAEATASTA